VTDKKRRTKECELSFLSEEEGVLSFFEDGKEILRFCVYPIGEHEAEITAQNVGILEGVKRIEEMPRKIIDKMTMYVMKALSTLEEYGFDTLWFVEQKSTIFEQILSSTNVVNKKHSEWMMKSTGRGKREAVLREPGAKTLIFAETETGYDCFDEEKQFFARICPLSDGWYVYEVEVVCDKRRTGIGTACMKALEERFLPLYLQVGSYNEPAVGLYRKLGYRVTEELCYYGKE